MRGNDGRKNWNEFAKHIAVMKTHQLTHFLQMGIEDPFYEQLSQNLSIKFYGKSFNGLMGLLLNIIEP